MPSCRLGQLNKPLVKWIYSEAFTTCGHDLFSCSDVVKLIVSSDMLLVLSTYSLGSNKIIDAGAQALAGSLHHCTYLQDLS